MVYFISRCIFSVLLYIITKLEVSGREHFPERGPFLIASNHASNIDPAVVGAACHTARVTFMAKRELFEAPRFGWWFKAVGCIPIERSASDVAPLREAIQALQRQAVIGIFPEGTRSHDGTLQRPQPGIGFLSAKTGSPIIPLYISGTDKVLPRGSKKIMSGKVRVRIGKALSPGDFKGMKKRELYESIGEAVMQRIADLKNG
jgi:1-acyl-sn-glycerol-3-phosphate acyltransferase